MAARGKRDFGSFHSSNVQELVSLATVGFQECTVKDDYQAPVIPVQLPSFTECVPFGEKAKQEHFLLDTKWTFLNHGAFGAALKQAVEAAQTWQLYCESQPLRFLDRELLPLMVYVIRRLAKFIDCDPAELVLVPNASTGINTVVRAVCRKLGSDDVITILNVTYGQ